MKNSHTAPPGPPSEKAVLIGQAALTGQAAPSEAPVLTEPVALGNQQAVLTELVAQG